MKSTGYKDIFFFLGTEAELIKVFPVIMECMQRDVVCHVIASGQNDLTKSRIMKEIALNGKFIELSRESDIEKSAKGLMKWFVKTWCSAVKQIKSQFDAADFKSAPMVVHGDTVSTFMGALVGRKLGCKVCHVEAGLRSHHLLNPFPEEIDRLLTSKIARVHFAPGEEPSRNLIHVKGQVVNTQYNTILDSLRYSKNMPIVSEALEAILDRKYFVFVMHRQENLANKEFVRQVVERVKGLAENGTSCVLILHKITESTLENMGILSELKENKQFVLLPRVDYFDFMKLLDGACYVITDGGSNQEELHYMGKPCLIMRKTTERQEGLGKNAVLFDGNMEQMSSFGREFHKYEISAGEWKESPSELIAKRLVEMREKSERSS